MLGRKKLLFIYRSRDGWSDSLSIMLESLKECFIVDAVNTFDGNSPSRWTKYDIVLVHHSINFYKTLFCILTQKVLGARVFFFAHEGEVVLGWRFAIKNRLINSLGTFLRYSRAWNLAPSIICDKTFCLSSNQAQLYFKEPVAIPFLSVDTEKFTDVVKYDKRERAFFFPSSHNRIEKGYERISYLNDFSSVTSAEAKTPAEMVKLYNRFQYVLIPSYIETYCLAMLEAMSCNCVIFISRDVGVLEYLLAKYTEVELEGYGIFIICNWGELYSFIQTIDFDFAPRTRELMFQSGLDKKSIAGLLKNHIED